MATSCWTRTPRWTFSLFTVKNFNAISKFGYLEIDPTRPRLVTRSTSRSIRWRPDPARDQQRPGQGRQLQGRQLELRPAMRRAATCRTTATLQVFFRIAGSVQEDPEGDCSAPLRRLPNSGVRIDLIEKRISSKL